MIPLRLDAITTSDLACAAGEKENKQRREEQQR
jgi:hypothetical protein